MIDLTNYTGPKPLSLSRTEEAAIEALQVPGDLYAIQAERLPDGQLAVTAWSVARQTNLLIVVTHCLPTIPFVRRLHSQAVAYRIEREAQDICRMIEQHVTAAEAQAVIEGYPYLLGLCAPSQGVPLHTYAYAQLGVATGDWDLPLMEVAL